MTTTIKKLETQTTTVAPQRLVILTLINSSISTISIFLILLIGINVVRLANKPIPSQVQLTDGSVIRTKTVDSYQREPEVIKEFTSKILTGLFTWNGYLPATTPEEATNPQPDPGVRVDNQKIATSTYEASLALDPQLRTPFLKNLSKIIPQTVFTNNKQIIFVASYISEPIAIKGKRGEWKVNVVANVLAFENGQSLDKAIPMNKQVFLKAVRPPKYDPEFSNPLAQKIAEYRQAGLEITEIRELTENDLN